MRQLRATSDGVNNSYQGDSLSGADKEAYDSNYQSGLGSVGVGNSVGSDDMMAMDPSQEEKGRVEAENNELKGDLGKEVGLGGVDVSFQDALKKKKKDEEEKSLKNALKGNKK